MRILYRDADDCEKAKTRCRQRRNAKYQMNFPKITLFFLLLHSIHCNQLTKESTTPTQPNEVKYVFAAAGLRLREAPDLNAKNIITLPYGSEVEILRKTGNTLSINYYLSGEWVEAKWKDKTGYAFDGYLLDKKEFARFDKVFQFVKRKIPEKKKSYRLSSELRIDEKWNWSQIQFNQKKSNSNFTIYTLFPNKTTDGEGCSLYNYSTCINVILDDKDNIVFTDLDFEPMGQIYYIDEEIVRFGYEGGEGDDCSSGGTETLFIYIFKSKTFVKRKVNAGSVCEDEFCDRSGNHLPSCKKWKHYRDEIYSPSEPSAKIKEYFKRTIEPEKK